MNATEPGSDDELASLLAACDEAMAGDGLASLQIGNLLTGQARLLKNLECVRMLRKIWPRHDSTLSKSPNSRPHAMPVPERLGRFSIDKELGRGGFGIVYLAFDPQLARLVALKVPRPDILSTPHLRERFRIEARAAAALDHPNIVAVHETGEIDSVAYIAAAYCPGVTLARWMDERPDGIPISLTVSIVAQLADGIEHAHQRNVLHRDVKPSNVMLVSPEANGVGDPIPKITDFGLARTLGGADSSLTTTGAILGTPNYLAPEQADGKGDKIGPAVDVYGLGTILYEMLTRRPPFVSDNALETLRQVRMEDPIPPRKLRSLVPRDLETICLKCLEKEPSHRYKSAADLAADLRRFAGNQSIIARPLGAKGRATKWIGRNPTVAVVCVAVALATVTLILGAGWYAHDRQSRKERAEQNVNAALQEAIALFGRAEGAERDLGLWRDAVAAAKHARKVAAVIETPPKLRERAETLSMEVERQDHNHRLIASLADIQASMGDDVLPTGNQDFPTANERYIRAFEAFGLDIYKMTAAEAAAALGRIGDKFRCGLGEALDNWGYVRMVLKEPDPNHLPKISRLLDPDPIRNRIRDAVIMRDRLAFERAIAEVHPEMQPVQTVNLVAVYRFWLARSPEYASEIEFLTRAQFHHPSDFQINHNLAFMLNRAERSAEAIPFARVAISVRPNSAVAWQDLAFALRRVGSDEEALAAHRQVVKICPKAIMHFESIGAILERMDRSAEAAVAYREAIDAVVMHQPRSTRFVTAWERYGLLDDVAAAYQKAVAAKPTDVETYIGLSYILRLLKRWTEYVAAYDAVIAVQPNVPQHYAVRSYGRAFVAHVTQGSFAGADADLARAIELGSKNPEVWYSHALLALVRGDRESYRLICTRMLKIFDQTTNSVDANAVAGAFGLAADVLTEAELNRAMQFANVAIAANPNQRSYVNTMGMVLFRLGRLENAMQFFQRSLQLSDHPADDVYDWFYLAMIHQKLGKPDLAREFFDKARDRMTVYVNDHPTPESAPEQWDAKLELQMLHREAAAALKIPKP